MQPARTLPNLLVPATVLGFLLGGLVLVYFFGLTDGMMMLLVFLWGSMLIGHPKLVLWLYWVWITISLYVQRLLSAMVTVWGDEMVVFVMIGMLLMHHIRHRIVLPDTRLVGKVLLGLFLLMIVSGLANDVLFMQGFHFTLQYMRFFLLFYFTYYFLTMQDLKWVVGTFTGLFLLQVAMNAGWLLNINPLPNYMGSVDFAVGTGLGANIVAYFSVAFICLMVAYLNHARLRYQKVLGGLAILLAVFELYITFTNHAYLLLILCVGFQLLLSRLPLGRKLAISGLGVLVLLLAWLIIRQMPSSVLLTESLRPDYVRLRWQKIMAGPKGQSYKNNFYYLPKDLEFPLLGGGPGNAGSMVGRMRRTPLADRYFNWVDLAVQRRDISEGFSITGGPMTGILTLWSELGFFGLLLYWGIQLYAAVRVARAVRAGAYTDRYQLILAESFPPTMIMLIMLNFIADYSYLAFMNNGIWIWAACVWTPNKPAFLRQAASTEVSSAVLSPSLVKRATTFNP